MILAAIPGAFPITPATMINMTHPAASCTEKEGSIRARASLSPLILPRRLWQKKIPKKPRQNGLMLSRSLLDIPPVFVDPIKLIETSRRNGEQDEPSYRNVQEQ